MSGRKRSKPKDSGSTRRRKKRAKSKSRERLETGDVAADGSTVPPPPMGGPPPGGYSAQALAGFPPPPTGPQPAASAARAMPPPPARPPTPRRGPANPRRRPAGTVLPTGYAPVEEPAMTGTPRQVSRTVSITNPQFDARSSAEAQQAADSQGRGRHEHGSVAPVGSRGILPENFQDLPPQDNEDAVHNPARGHRQQLSPTHAASSDVHGQPVAPPPSSAPRPPSIPPESAKQADRRRRAQMWAATPQREAREERDYGGATREMAALESASDAGGETPDPFGGYTPDPYGASDHGAASPALPDLGIGAVQGDTSVSRSRSHEGTETDTSVLDLTREEVDLTRDVPDKPPEKVDLTQDSSQERELVRGMDVVQEDVVEPWKDTWSWDPREEHHSSRSTSYESGFAPSPEESDPDSDVQIVDKPLRMRGGTGTPPPRRGSRNRKRPAQFGTQTGGTPDQNRPPDYSGQTEGHSGRAAIPVDEMFRQALGSPSLPGRQPRGMVAVRPAGSPVHADPRHQARAEQRRRAQVQVAHRITPDLAGLPSPPPPSPGVPPGKRPPHPDINIKKTNRWFSYSSRPDGRHVWENDRGRFALLPDGKQKFIKASKMRKLHYTFKPATNSWERHPFQQAGIDARHGLHMSGVPVYTSVVDRAPPPIARAGVFDIPDFYRAAQPAPYPAAVSRIYKPPADRSDPRIGRHRGRGSYTLSALLVSDLHQEQMRHRAPMRGRAPSARPDIGPDPTEEEKARHLQHLREQRTLTRSRSPSRDRQYDSPERSRSFSPGRTHYRHRSASPGSGRHYTTQRRDYSPGPLYPFSPSPASVSGSLMGRMATGTRSDARSRTRSYSQGTLRALSEHRSPSPVSGLSGSFAAASVVAGPVDPRTPHGSRSGTRSGRSGSRELGEITDDEPDVYNPDELAFEPADTIPEEDAEISEDDDYDIPAAYNPGRMARILGPVARRRPPVPGAPRIRRYGRRRVANRTSIGTAVNRVHGPFRGALSTMPKLSWQHLAPGHYIAKARQGMTPGIQQHVLKLLKRAKGYIWINGKRMSIARARAHLLKLLATRASVDIKLTNDFPFP